MPPPDPAHDLARIREDLRLIAAAYGTLDRDASGLSLADMAFFRCPGHVLALLSLYDSLRPEVEREVRGKIAGKIEAEAARVKAKLEPPKGAIVYMIDDGDIDRAAALDWAAGIARGGEGEATG